MPFLALVFIAGLAVVFATARAEHALASALWGLATLLFFVPAGALLALVVADHEPLFSVLALAIVLSGVADGVALLFLANRLRQRRDAPRETIAWLTLAHHAAVFVAFGAALLVSGDGSSSGSGGLEALASMLGALAVPCTIGGFLGWRLLAARVAVAQPA